MQHAIINAMKCMRAINDRIARPVYQLENHLSQPLYPHGVSTGEIIGPCSSEPVNPSQLGGRHSNPVVTTRMKALDFSGTTHQSASHNVAFNQVINQSVNQDQDVLQVYVGINNKGKAQNREELLPRSSKLTDEQPDQISQESSTSSNSTLLPQFVLQPLKKPAVSLNKNQQQPTYVAFAKEHKNDAASTNQNDTASLQQLTTYSFQNNQQLVALNNSNNVVKDTSPLLPTADQKRCTQNAVF
ncbi:hypothetical protein F511_06721 [Dorcoceras hygrometricum]|uniref:Uncharacterized protein n=1 Tax=Dorcoceras hygrometricum TaxID=472368 RepID=A0A2Z7A994_9LAMI|nr:hypothetical protein F511_06721 [Dorcoceras hygrometricum]